MGNRLFLREKRGWRELERVKYFPPVVVNVCKLLRTQDSEETEWSEPQK